MVRHDSVDATATLFTIIPLNLKRTSEIEDKIIGRLTNCCSSKVEILSQTREQLTLKVPYDYDLRMKYTGETLHESKEKRFQRKEVAKQVCARPFVVTILRWGIYTIENKVRKRFIGTPDENYVRDIFRDLHWDMVTTKNIFELHDDVDFFVQSPLTKGTLHFDLPIHECVTKHIHEKCNSHLRRMQAIAKYVHTELKEASSTETNDLLRSFERNSKEPLVRLQSHIRSISKSGKLADRFRFDKAIREIGNALKATDAFLSKATKRKFNPTQILYYLRSCKPGQSDWRRFQELCRDVLDFLFVPQVTKFDWESKAGRKRRDLVSCIPSKTNKFWEHVRSEFGNCFLVDAKNWNELPGSEVEKVAKYLGPHKLGRFGIVVCRTKVRKEVKETIRDLLREDEKMLIVLADKDLIEMVENKQQDDDPEDVLERKMQEVYKSL